MPPTFSFLPLPGLREGDLLRDAMDGDVVRPEKGRCALTLATLRVVVLWLGFSLGTSSTQSTQTVWSEAKRVSHVCACAHVLLYTLV